VAALAAGAACRTMLLHSGGGNVFILTTLREDERPMYCIHRRVGTAFRAVQTVWIMRATLRENFVSQSESAREVQMP
jgi:hypothetical protein